MNGWELSAFAVGLVMVIAVWAMIYKKPALSPEERLICRRYATAAVRLCEVRDEGIPDAEAERAFRDAAVAMLECGKQAEPTTQPAEGE